MCTVLEGCGCGANRSKTTAGGWMAGLATVAALGLGYRLIAVAPYLWLASWLLLLAMSWPRTRRPVVRAVAYLARRGWRTARPAAGPAAAPAVESRTWHVELFASYPDGSMRRIGATDVTGTWATNTELQDYTINAWIAARGEPHPGTSLSCRATQLAITA